MLNKQKANLSIPISNKNYNFFGDIKNYNFSSDLSPKNERLGSITKSHVTRYGGGLQSRAKNKAPFEKLRLADFSIMGQWSCLEFRFLCVLGGL